MKITIIETPTHQSVYSDTLLVASNERDFALDLHAIREFASYVGFEFEVHRGALPSVEAQGFPPFLPDALRMLDVDEAQPVSNGLLGSARGRFKALAEAVDGDPRELREVERQQREEEE